MSAAALTGLPAAGCLAPLGSAASMLLRSLSAVSQSLASEPMVAVLVSFVGFAFGGKGGDCGGGGGGWEGGSGADEASVL